MSEPIVGTGECDTCTAGHEPAPTVPLWKRWNTYVCAACRDRLDAPQPLAPLGTDYHTRTPDAARGYALLQS